MSRPYNTRGGINNRSNNLAPEMTDSNIDHMESTTVRRGGKRGANWTHNLKKQLAYVFSGFAERLRFTDATVLTDQSRYEGNEVYFLNRNDVIRMCGLS